MSFIPSIVVNSPVEDFEGFACPLEFHHVINESTIVDDCVSFAERVIAASSESLSEISPDSQDVNNAGPVTLQVINQSLSIARGKWSRDFREK